MKLDYSYNDISQVLTKESTTNDSIVEVIAFDSRRILDGNNALFFALTTGHRDGHDYVEDAYSKGVRKFVISNQSLVANFPDADFIMVKDTFQALLDLAKFHRNRFDCPIVAITGSNGKTTVKEWLSSMLTSHFRVAKSPKSYNSKLGVALSLFELSIHTDIGIIEVGVAGKNQMKDMAELIQPTHGILTSFGRAHRELFDSELEHWEEKITLFNSIQFLCPESINQPLPKNAIVVRDSINKELLESLRFQDKAHIENASLAIEMALHLGCTKDDLLSIIPRFSALSLRLETFNGTHGNLIINDTYSLDLDSLYHSLSYQLANSNGKKRVVIIGLSKRDEKMINEIQEIVSQFEPLQCIFHFSGEAFDEKFQDSCILMKGNREVKMEHIARKFQLQHHQTYLEIDLKAIRHNIQFHRSKLKNDTKLLCMVKASSYGSDARTIGTFLEKQGVDYLGVAYPDEGIELREKGVTLPILVMNCEESSFQQCIQHQLEPSIFSIDLLDRFIRELIHQEQFGYPIHIKLETGMNRLGIEEKDVSKLISLLESQPEVRVKSIYSHLAESDIHNSSFTQQQILLFENFSDIITTSLPYPIIRHILNSNGILNYPNAQFDMVRLGIGMYGALEHNNLRQAISWYSSISQLKVVKKGSSVGYGRTFKATQEMQIAIIPVGYADGYKRILSNGVGEVVINGSRCKIVGAVCMDMIMVDVTHTNVHEGEMVELIGEQLTVVEFAEKCKTIPYEILTSFSSRIHRIYIDQ